MKAKNGKLWGTMRNGEIEIRTLTLADLDGALETLDKSFFLYESVCNACGINLLKNAQARAELRELCRITAKDGVSLVAIEAATGAVVGASFNKIQYVPENDEEPFFLTFRKDRTHSQPAQELMDFMIGVDGQNDVFALYNIDCACELMFLATLPEWQGLHIGRKLAEYTIEFTRDLSNGIGIEDINMKLRHRRPKAITALFTSAFSQRIGRAQGFKVIDSVTYEKYGKCNGKTFDHNRINEMHKTCEHVILLI